jgi:hypothetical protein
MIAPVFWLLFYLAASGLIIAAGTAFSGSTLEALKETLSTKTLHFQAMAFGSVGLELLILDRYSLGQVFGP